MTQDLIVIRKEIKVNRKLRFSGLMLAGGVLLSACSRNPQDMAPITAESTGFWAKLVYLFAQAIDGLSFGHIGVGIILFTILIRTVLLPLYNMQIKSSRKMQDLQPKLRELQKQYSGKDNESRLALTEATSALYKAEGVSPYTSMWPLFIQLPLMIALYQALLRVEFLKEGSFLWFKLAEPDHLFILPVLAAAFTFLSTWLTNKGVREKNVAMTIMSAVAPIMILMVSLNIASGVSLYWTVSNAYQVVQTLLFNNPFKLIAEREQLAQAEKEKEARIRRAKKKAHRRK